MHDIRAIRDAPQAFEQAMRTRRVEVQVRDIAALDAELRALTGDKQTYERARNAAAREAGQARAANDTGRFEALRATSSDCREKAAQTEDGIKDTRARLNALLAGLPNLPDPRVPEGASEADNIEVRTVGVPREFAFAVRDHVSIGTALMTASGAPMLDFTDTARISGARFVTLRADLARLERALAHFMIDMHTAHHGYTEISPPLLVSEDAAYGTGQLPKFADDLFRINTGSYAIPTAEIPLTNLARERIFDATDLPQRMTAATPCFRAEAGAAGKDTRGLIRLHQFLKVELVSICTPEQSDAEHERMTSCAEAVLRALDLPYRVIELCTADMGFSARRTYDLEVWMPSGHSYREVSSCSNCGDFQARRMAARLRSDPKKSGARLGYVHTLNGSALAVGRTMAALLENCQNEDGSVDLPPAIRPFMGGQARLG